MFGDSVGSPFVLLITESRGGMTTLAGWLLLAVHTPLAMCSCSICLVLRTPKQNAHLLSLVSSWGPLFFLFFSFLSNTVCMYLFISGMRTTWSVDIKARWQILSTPPYSLMTSGFGALRQVIATSSEPSGASFFFFLGRSYIIHRNRYPVCSF